MTTTSTNKQLLDELERLTEDHQDNLRDEIRKKIMIATTSPRLEFPVDSFPDRLAEMIRSYNACYGLPTEYFGLTMLTVAGTLLGNAYMVEDRGYLHPPLLYSVVVGKPSIGKTPAIKFFLGPLFEIQKNYRRLYKEKKREYDEAMRDGKGDYTEPREFGILANDATVEAINRLLQANARGILLYRDEIKGWIASMNQYRKGADEAFWLENWSNSTIIVNRVGAETLFIEKPFCSVIGAIQPGILKKLAEGGKDLDGFVARLLFAFPDDAKKTPYSKMRPDPELMAVWTYVVNWLHGLPSIMVEPSDRYGDWDIQSVKIGLTQEAQDLYEQFYNRNAEAINQTDDEVVDAIFGKFDSYCLRLALIIEFLEFATQGIDDIRIEECAERKISKESMTRAINLCKYFQRSALKVVNRLAGPVEQLDTKRRVWYETLPEEFSRSLAIDLGDAAAMSSRTVARLLNDTELFQRVRQGIYWKKYL